MCLLLRLLHDTEYVFNILNVGQARDMESLLLAIQMACKTISNLVNRAGLANDLGEKNSDYSDGRFYSMKRLDLLSTIVLKNALQFTGKCECVAPGPKVDTESPAEHQPGVLIASALDSNYVVSTCEVAGFVVCLVGRYLCV